ncbi:hypothetical protein Moror_7949 [Moniliophthora roreri MCA 2997]|uniref:Uncharacterized protein n=2 Tax=Moniliophthora roreri TaxID=221103 RepID=V2XLG6_MONRO|nr:hypothetical protein Moror_7949 [Moniliophthora roreri MCA 2997]
MGFVAVSMKWVLFRLGLGALVGAQSQEATCDPTTGFDWSFNSLHQSPCEMASALAGQCRGGAFIVPPLPANNAYRGIGLGEDDLCRCNTVFYSLLSACAACQARSWLRWSTFAENCTTRISSSFPFNIPSGTRIPPYAYLDILANDTFNPALAQSLANAPESTGTPPPTFTSSGAPATSPAPGSSTSASSGGSGSSKSNAGPIVGGVIGGLVIVCLTIILIIWFIRRRKTNTPPSGLVDIDPSFPAVRGTERGSTQELPKLYNPSDPSTFPPSISPTPSPSMSASPPPTRDARWSYYSAAPTTHIPLHPNRYGGNPEI